ncbi:MAG: SAVED domain-containing protein [Candidatus Heimdallarchaeota archaeon]
MKSTDLYWIWSSHAGRCAFPNCKTKLFKQTESGSILNIGEKCHIIGKSPCGPRGHPTRSEILNEDPDNIILLCRNHHKTIDADPKYSAEDSVRQMKTDHLNWVEERLVTELIDEYWTLCILSDADFGSIDESRIKNQFFPELNFSSTTKHISKEITPSFEQWNKEKAKITDWWKNIRENDTLPPNYAFFAISHIPFLIYGGYLLRDSRSMKLFQFDRFRNTWRWRSEASQLQQFDFKTTSLIENETEVAISVSISNKVALEKIEEVLPSVNTIEFFIDNPSRTWLRYEHQLIIFKEKFTNLLDKVIQLNPNIKMMHLFCAVPAPFALAIGTLINPAMFPAIQTYKFFRNNTPSYIKAIKFNNN